MPEYLHPGVYIEETSYKLKPIEGVATSTAGLVGRAVKGPVGRPTLVTSFAEFRRKFGDAIQSPTGYGDYLGHAVRAFFDNGGKRTYIVRVLGQGNGPASVALSHGTVMTMPPNAVVRGGAQTIPVVSLRNFWLRDPGSVPPPPPPTGTVEVFTRPDIGSTVWTSQGTLTVDGYDATRNQLHLQAPLAGNTRWTAANTYLRIQGAGPIAPGGPTFTARNPGQLSRANRNLLSVEFRASDLPPVRLRTARLARARPVIHQFPGGTGAIADHMTLPATALQMLRPGDTIRLTDPAGVTDVEVTSIPPVTVPLAAAFGAAVEHGTVTLTHRGGNPLPGGGVALGDLGAGDAGMQPTAPAGNAAKMPHAIAAYLHNGDEFSVGGTSYAVTGNVEFAAGPDNVTLAPGGAPRTDPSVTLVSTVATGPTVRLMVASTGDLVAPFLAAAPEPIAVTDDRHTERSRALLVDPGQGFVLVPTPAAAGDQFPNQVTPTSWTALEGLRIPAANPLPVASTASFYQGAIVEVDDGTTKQSGVVDRIDAAARTITLAAPIAAPIVLATDPTQRHAYVRTLEIDVLVYENGVLRESFPGLTWNENPAAASFQRFYPQRVNDPSTGSQLVTVAAPLGVSADPDGQPTTATGQPAELTGGSDGIAIAPHDLVGLDNGPGHRTGIEALRERDDIALVAVPGVTDETVQQALLTHCELLKYRFAVLDGIPHESDVSRIQQHRNNYDSSYAAYYLPWLWSTDPLSGAALLVPPSGHVLGICARVDNDRGVWKAPANEVVRGITGVELPFGDGEQDVLNPTPGSVDLIRELTGRGIRVWGARTCSSDSEWKYVNVRRLFIFLEHSIDNGTQWCVFEPNTPALWQRVRESIESFLFDIWSQGALMGRKPDEAYFVRCDETTMTQDDIDNGRLVCQIGVSPAYPAEFVIFRIGQWTASRNS